MTYLINWFRRRFLYRHNWRETGGAFSGAESICLKCGAWDAMTGLYCGKDRRHPSEK